MPGTAATTWLQETVDRATWLLDGNFESDRVLLGAKAEQIVWLDLSLPLTVLRVAKRKLDWWLVRQPVSGKKRMHLVKALTGIRHAVRASRSKRQTYPGYFAELDHADVVILRSRSTVRAWIESVRNERRAEGCR